MMLKSILVKEFRQFRRDSFIPKLMVIFPVMIMLLMPLVTNLDVKHVNVAVVDLDGSEMSRRMLEKINASEYLTLQGVYYTSADGFDKIESTAADILVEIPNGYEKSLKTASPLQLNISANAVNGTKGSLGLQYVLQTVTDGAVATAPDNSVRYLYNPTLDYKQFMIPALMIMIVILICGFLPALNIVSEKEHGTIEQLNVSPMGKFTFTIGKLILYWVMGLVIFGVAMIIAWLVYGLTPSGSIGAIFLAAFIFIVSMSCLGVIIANTSHTMPQVKFVMFFFIIVFLLMSGLLTPVSSMPRWAEIITYGIPPRYFIDIMRGTYLRGAGFSDLLFPFAMLTFFALLLALIATLTYRKQSN